MCRKKIAVENRGHDVKPGYKRKIGARVMCHVIYRSHRDSGIS
jgi:hypothetical protein